MASAVRFPISPVNLSSPARDEGNGGWIMPDRRSLTVIGFIYGGITAIVVLIACLVVTYHLAGRLSIDSQATATVQSQTR